MIRYGIRFGCRFGTAHDMVLLKDTPNAKIERCRICSRRFRWNKGYKGRIDNQQYLYAHVRNFAQRWGSTKRVYYKIHHPEKATIHI